MIKRIYAFYLSNGSGCCPEVDENGQFPLTSGVRKYSLTLRGNKLLVKYESEYGECEDLLTLPAVVNESFIITKSKKDLELFESIYSIGRRYEQKKINDYVLLRIKDICEKIENRIVEYDIPSKK